MKKKTITISVIAIIAIATAFIILNSEQASGTPITVYKSPVCGCCVGYSEELMKAGFDVDLVTVEDMQEIKSKYRIPFEMQSCHTSIIGDYFVEGHVPIDELRNLMIEMPHMEGIALPGMPAGTPGMPGYKNKDWVIYSLTEGEYSEFKRI